MSLSLDEYCNFVFRVCIDFSTIAHMYIHRI